MSKSATYWATDYLALQGSVAMVPLQTLLRAISIVLPLRPWRDAELRIGKGASRKQSRDKPCGAPCRSNAVPCQSIYAGLLIAPHRGAWSGPNSQTVQLALGPKRRLHARGLSIAFELNSRNTMTLATSQTRQLIIAKDCCWPT